MGYTSADRGEGIAVHRLMGAFVVALGIVGVGCVSERPLLSQAGPDTVARIAAVGAGEQPGLARAQQPDAPSKSPAVLTGVPADPAAEAARAEPAARIAA